MSSFPHYKQLDAMDCGPTSLRIIARYYGKSYSLQTLRDKCHINREGVSLLGISDAAESIGFRTVGVKITWKQLREEVPLPCIVYWQQRHFLVVYGIRKKKGHFEILISDPASERLTFSEESFLNSWLDIDNVKDMMRLETSALENSHGIALLLEPTPEFYKEKDDEDNHWNFGYLLEYLRPYKTYICQILLAMLMASAISLILPFVTQSIVDIGIGTSSISFIVIMLVAQLVLVMGQLCNNLIRSWLMLHMTTRVSISLISDFLCKLMRLPIAFFDSKLVGDIMQRIGDYNRVQAFLTGSLLSMVVAMISFMIYCIVMGGYNLGVFNVFLLGSVFYILWILIFLKRRRRLDYIRFQEASVNQSNIVQLIEGMQDIKLNNCEKQKRWEWEGIQARLFKVSVKSLALGQAQEFGGLFIDQAKNFLISFLAARSVIDGTMTLGMMMALQYIIGQLNAPIEQFITFVREAQDASISLERMDEIQKCKDEEPDDEQKICSVPDDLGIEFRNVTFQYDGPHSPQVLHNVSFLIPANKVTAIVGVSGSGKTTLLKMMLGFYHPVSGSVFLGNTALKNYSESCWRKCCGSVMQEGYIFSDTIAENIGISDEYPDMIRVREAAEVSNIREWIESLPLGYNTKIGADGHGLSVGQKQRILIARAVYKDAKYLFFDEATNSLDANNERVIMDNLNLLFKDKTVVIVAHRLSTVKNADNIIVLDDGQVVEQGTHKELARMKGKYYTLVKNQLELGN